jgi:hypothetical protein
MKWSDLPSNVLPESNQNAEEPPYGSVPFDRDALLAAMTRDWSQLTPQAAMAFANRLVHPEDARTIVNESVLLDRDHSAHHVTVRFRLEAADVEDVVLLPYARPRKGDVLELLEVSTPQGTSVERLTYNQTGSLLSLILIRLFHQFEHRVSATDADWVYETIDDIVSNYQSEETITTASARFKGMFGGVPEEQTSMFFDLLRVAGLRRPLVAQLPPVNANSATETSTSTVEVSFNYVDRATSAHVDAPGTDRWEDRKQRYRKRIGAAPNKIAIKLDRALSSSSFQLFVHPSEGSYISDAVVIDGDSSLVPPNMEHGERHPVFVSWSTTKAKPCSTLHTFRFAGTGLTRPKFVVRIRETPPGLLSHATIGAAVVLLTVWICGTLFPGFHATASEGTYPSPQATDVVAFILGVPAVFGAWMSILSATRRQYSSLAARSSLITTSVIGVLSATLYLLHVKHPHASVAWLGDRHRAVLLIPEVGWSILFLIALGNFLASALTLFIRLRRYRRHLSAHA